MKKNILIIGYGNIANRLHAILCKDSYKIYGISRSKKRGLKNFIKWDWLSKDLPNIQCNNFDSIINNNLDPDNLDSNTDGFNVSASQDKISAWKDIWSAGQGVGLIKNIESVESIVEKLESEFLQG